MRLVLYALAILFLAINAPPTNQNSANSDACKFELSTSSGQPSITGPDNIVPLIHIVDQPDSPVEITAIDFTEAYLSVYNERFMEQLRCRIKVRNRSDMTIRDVSVSISLSDRGASLRGGTQLGVTLAPGEEREVQACGRGTGRGSAKANRVLIAVAVSGVAFDSCDYLPSARIPRHLSLPALNSF